MKFACGMGKKFQRIFACMLSERSTTTTMERERAKKRKNMNNMLFMKCKTHPNERRNEMWNGKKKESVETI